MLFGLLGMESKSGENLLSLKCKDRGGRVSEDFCLER